VLKIYDTLTKKKSAFKPIHEKKVSMYVCGMTVYDYCHIGHARTMVSFDIIYRYLKHLGYDVNYIRNITDIDDKIIQRAQKNNEPFHELTERFIRALEEDTKALNILPPISAPKATDFISHMIKLIETLIQKNLAYAASNGDVYYAVHQFKSYGELAHQNIDKLRSGSRVSILEAKNDPLDFVLWKLAKPGEPSWDSPWGKGRPGWHIECSAMCLNCLGESIDIHGGGFDLVFPHHQNEVAQSEGVTEQKLANYWMHAGLVTINKEKMSKSLNNFFTIREVLDKYPPEVVRYFMLTSHYRSPLNYSVELLMQSQSALERLYQALREVDISNKDSHQFSAEKNEFTNRFHEAMQDDFNTPVALAVLFDLAREINKTHNPTFALTLKSLGQLLGLLEKDPEMFFQQQANKEVIQPTEIEQLIALRNDARAQKNWTEADRIRQELEQKGVLIEDSPAGTRWKRLTVE
jgi:cysteinyl-tRNA synthetase